MMRPIGSLKRPALCVGHGGFGQFVTPHLEAFARGHSADGRSDRTRADIISDLRRGIRGVTLRSI